MSTVIDTLVYDRTQADVDRVFTLKNKILAGGLSSLTTAEKAEYMAGMKGAYNYGDMNRVGTAVAYIANRMTTIPTELETYREGKGVAEDDYFDVPYDPASVVVSAKTDWAMGNVPAQSQIATYLGNLTTLRSMLSLPADAPSVPSSLNGMTFGTANDIEKLLYVIDTTLTEVETERYSRIDRAVASFAYAGVMYCGE